MGAKRNTNARKHRLYARHIDVGNLSGLRVTPPQAGRAAVCLILGMTKYLFDLPARLGNQLAVQPERIEGYWFRDKLIKSDFNSPNPFPLLLIVVPPSFRGTTILFSLPTSGFHLGREGVWHTIRSTLNSKKVTLMPGDLTVSKKGKTVLPSCTLVSACPGVFLGSW